MLYPYYAQDTIMDMHSRDITLLIVLLFAVSKDEWDTKEDTGKSMKNVLYVLRYAKSMLLGSNSEKTKPVALANIELHFSEGISQSVSQLLRKSVTRKNLF